MDKTTSSTINTISTRAAVSQKLQRHVSESADPKPYFYSFSSCREIGEVTTKRPMVRTFSKNLKRLTSDNGGFSVASDTTRQKSDTSKSMGKSSSRSMQLYIRRPLLDKSRTAEINSSLQELDVFTLGLNPINNTASIRHSFKLQFLKVLYYPLCYLAIGGIFPGNAHPKLQKNSSKLIFQIPFIYRIVLGLIHLSNLGRVFGYCTAYLPTANESELARYIVATFGMLYGSMLFLSEHLVTKLYFKPFVDSLADYEATFGFLIDISERRRRMKRVTLLMVAFSILTAAGWDALGSEDANNFVSFPFRDNDFSIAVVILVHVGFCAYVFLVTSPVFGLLLFYTMILDIIRDEFESTSRLLLASLRSRDKAELRFDKCRQRYQNLCDIVEVFSRLTRGFVVVSFVFNMTSMFVSIFGLSSSTVSPDLVMFQELAGMTFNLIVILFLTITWGRLHCSAHAVSQAVSDAPWSQTSKRMLQKMSLLLAQFSTTKVGINVCGLFIMDSSTPLMVTGTLVTYGIVVLQFQLDKDSLHRCELNNTEL
ncbi:unnamed protein product [Lymnaea stagnalis]|uniref:Gustatory receptor n=1 Tax=Lymnaea stagnalis TaxID=6523 RepID=A0AAV2I0P5_LYMST